MATVIIYPDCNETVAHLGGVILAVARTAQTGGLRARAKLVGHRKTGNARIEVEHGSVDSFVSLVDPGGNAVAIEFGRTGAMGRGSSQGIHVITGGIW